MRPTQLGHGPGARRSEFRAHQCDASYNCDCCGLYHCCCVTDCPSILLRAAASRCTRSRSTGQAHPAPLVVGLIGHRHCFARPGHAASSVTCHVISWAWRGIAWRRRCQLTVPQGCSRLYTTVHDCIDHTGYDVRLPVSCRCSCPAWQDQEPLHLQTPHFIIDTQRTPRAPALENFITQGPAMTSLWNAHPPGHMPTLCNTHCFLYARIERTDHRQRHSGSGLDVRMSQCNAMQCTAGQGDGGNKW